MGANKAAHAAPTSKFNFLTVFMVFPLKRDYLDDDNNFSELANPFRFCTCLCSRRSGAWSSGQELKGSGRANSLRGIKAPGHSQARPANARKKSRSPWRR